VKCNTLLPIKERMGTKGWIERFVLRPGFCVKPGKGKMKQSRERDSSVRVTREKGSMGHWVPSQSERARPPRYENCGAKQGRCLINEKGAHPERWKIRISKLPLPRHNNKDHRAWGGSLGNLSTGRRCLNGRRKFKSIGRKALAQGFGVTSTRLKHLGGYTEVTVRNEIAWERKVTKIKGAGKRRGVGPVGRFAGSKGMTSLERRRWGGGGPHYPNGTQV